MERLSRTLVAGWILLTVGCTRWGHPAGFLDQVDKDSAALERAHKQALAHLGDAPAAFAYADALAQAMSGQLARSKHELDEDLPLDRLVADAFQTLDKLDPAHKATALAWKGVLLFDHARYLAFNVPRERLEQKQHPYIVKLTQARTLLRASMAAQPNYRAMRALHRVESYLSSAHQDVQNTRTSPEQCKTIHAELSNSREIYELMGECGCSVSDLAAHKTWLDRQRCTWLTDADETVFADIHARERAAYAHREALHEAGARAIHQGCYDTCAADYRTCSQPGTTCEAQQRECVRDCDAAVEN